MTSGSSGGSSRDRAVAGAIPNGEHVSAAAASDMHGAASRRAGESVLQLLAHRYPFLLLDRIDEVEPGRRAVAMKRVTAGEWFCRSPGTGAAVATMPHALVLEALAQASGAVLVDLLEGGTDVVGYFVGLQRVRFRAPAPSGCTLRLEVELLRFRRSLARLRGRATCEDGLVVSAELTVALRAAG